MSRNAYGVTKQALRANVKQNLGICRVCTKPAEYRRTLCEGHLKRERERKNKKRSALLKKGLCVEPKCGQPILCPHTRCERHMAESRIYNRSYYLYKRASRRPLKKGSRDKQNG